MDIETRNRLLEITAILTKQNKIQLEIIKQLDELEASMKECYKKLKDLKS